MSNANPHNLSRHERVDENEEAALGGERRMKQGSLPNSSHAF